MKRKTSGRKRSLNCSGTIPGFGFSYTPKDDVSEETGPWESLKEDGTKLFKSDVELLQIRNWKAAARNR